MFYVILYLCPECVKNASIQDTGKRTVFKRLGDEISQYSVTSTTPFEDDDQLSLSSRKSREDTTKSIQEKVGVQTDWHIVRT